MEVIQKGEGAGVLFVRNRNLEQAAVVQIWIRWSYEERAFYAVYI
jgi:hypothetical protein